MATEKRLIDANALLEKAQWYEYEEDYEEMAFKYIDPDDVEDAPAVDAVEVVHGRWNKETDMDEEWGEMDYYKCSVCGKCQFGETNYCPNCGADMREREDNGN